MDVLINDNVLTYINSTKIFMCLLEEKYSIFFRNEPPTIIVSTLGKQNIWLYTFIKYYQ